MKISNRLITLINCLISNLVFCVVALQAVNDSPKTVVSAALLLAVFHPVILRIAKVSSFEFDADDRSIKLEAQDADKR